MTTFRPRLPALSSPLSPALTAVCTAALSVGMGLSAAACSSGAEATKQEEPIVTEPAKPDAEPVDPGEGPGEPEERVAEQSEPVTFPETSPDASDRPGLARPLPDVAARRIQAAQRRLQQTEAGQVVWDAIEAHGGLNRWFTYGPMRFRFNYQPIGEGTAHDTFQTVDQWSARARHVTFDDSLEFGWTGEKAWYKPADATPPYNVRFWSLTPYYFVGMPFVLADPGVDLELVGEVELDGEDQQLVRVTFDEGTGDAPGDYYLVYIDEESKRVNAIRYVVSYPGFYPDGGHGPEKFMDFESEQNIDGLVFPLTYTTYAWEGDRRGEPVTKTELTNIEFLPDTPTSYFDAPEDAKIVEGW